ncbi:hypothetical protein ACEPAI_9880 [Sanghuangporus weigelae]
MLNALIDIIVHLEVNGKLSSIAQRKGSLNGQSQHGDEFLDEKRIKAAYYNEVEELLRKVTGGKRVLIFDHTSRRNYSDGNIVDPKYRDLQEPVQRVHYHMGAETERLLKGRVRIINVWRPIGHPVAPRPLAVADYRSLDAEYDLVPT